MSVIKNEETLKVVVMDKDIDDAVYFYNEVNEGQPGMPIKRSDLGFCRVKHMDPAEFIDDTSFFDETDDGWLLTKKAEDWATEMKEMHSRDFSRIIKMWKSGMMNAGISINGELGDGRARAIFFHAIGERIPVALFVTRPNEKYITKC